MVRRLPKPATLATLGHRWADSDLYPDVNASVDSVCQVGLPSLDFHNHSGQERTPSGEAFSGERVIGTLVSLLPLLRLASVRCAGGPSGSCEFLCLLLASNGLCRTLLAYIRWGYYHLSISF